ncbi:MAG: DNA repair protein RecO [Thermoanaerobaculales bacterium]
MPSRSDEAIVLARYPFRERDFIVALLTRESGQVRVVARRVRSARAAGASATEPLAKVRASYFERAGRELATLDEAEVIRSAFSLAAVPLAWAAGQVVAELALVYCPAGQRNEATFRLVDLCILRLIAGHDPVAVVHYAELWFLRLSGVFPELDRCGVCGAALPPGARTYDPSERGFVCAEHRPRGPAVRIDAAGVAWLSDASRESLDLVAAPPPDDVAGWLAGLREHFTDRRLQSWKYFRHLLGEPRMQVSGSDRG